MYWWPSAASLNRHSPDSGSLRGRIDPNYLIVIGELAILPIAFDAPVIAAAFSAANAVFSYAACALSVRRLAQAPILERCFPDPPPGPLVPHFRVHTAGGY